jgi:hypothetical protein
VPGAEADTDTKQASRQITADAGVESIPGAAPVDYRFAVNYTNFSYKYGIENTSDGITEHTVGAKLGMSAAFGGTQRIGVDSKFNYFNYDLPTASIADFNSHLDATLIPYYLLEGEFWNVRLGVNVLFITGNYKKLFATPNVSADVNIGAKTVLYVSATGGLRSNSAFQLSREKRYIHPYDNTIPSRILLDATAGVRSGIAPGFWFNLFGGYKVTADDYFFIPYLMSEGFGNMSRTLPLNSDLLYGGLELKYAWQRLAEVSLKGVYNHWKVTNKRMNDDLLSPEWKPYGRPVTELTASVLIRPVDKLSASVDYYLATGRVVRENWNEKMKNINELNFTASYTINDTFGVYLKANNLLFQRYEIIYGYPLQGFNIMAGININF